MYSAGLGCLTIDNYQEIWLSFSLSCKSLLCMVYSYFRFRKGTCQIDALENQFIISTLNLGLFTHFTFSLQGKHETYTHAIQFYTQETPTTLVIRHQIIQMINNNKTRVFLSSSCWLSVTNGVIYAFVGPALAVILVSENVCRSCADGIVGHLL